MLDIDQGKLLENFLAVICNENVTDEIVRMVLIAAGNMAIENKQVSQVVMDTIVEVMEKRAIRIVLPDIDFQANLELKKLLETILWTVDTLIHSGLTDIKPECSRSFYSICEH